MKIRTRNYLLDATCPQFNDGGGGGGGGDGGSGGASAYTPPASQADLDRIIEDRLARERKRYADYDDLKAKAEKHDALEAELASDKDKAVAAAREEERTKVRSESTPRIVRAEFKAEAKGVLTSEQLDTLLEDLDLSKYVDDKGEPDGEKIAKKVKAFAPADNNGNNSGRPPRRLGQGSHQPANAKPGDQGRAMAEKRFGSKSA
jgi:hypothetical protein